jgi:hypothetical protein|tara:strand:- start:34004 stop:34495 length:492 start_codon:yes stop_codon:yes gene_type:complete
MGRDLDSRASTGVTTDVVQSLGVEVVEGPAPGQPKPASSVVPTGDVLMGLIERGYRIGMGGLRFDSESQRGRMDSAQIYRGKSLVGLMTVSSGHREVIPTGELGFDELARAIQEIVEAQNGSVTYVPTGPFTGDDAYEAFAGLTPATTNGRQASEDFQVYRGN